MAGASAKTTRTPSWRARQARGPGTRRHGRDGRATSTHRLEHPGFGLIAHRVEPGPVKPCSGEAVVAELGDQLMSFPGDTSPEDLELGADRAACLLGLAGHPGIQRDPHRRPAPMAGGIMVWSTRSSMATGSSQCGHSPPARPGRESPQVSHRCWPNARVPQPAHSYTVIGRRGRPRAGTTITLGVPGAGAATPFFGRRRSSKGRVQRPRRRCDTAGRGPSRRRRATARPDMARRPAG